MSEHNPADATPGFMIFTSPSSIDSIAAEAVVNEGLTSNGVTRQRTVSAASSARSNAWRKPASGGPEERGGSPSTSKAAVEVSGREVSICECSQREGEPRRDDEHSEHVASPVGRSAVESVTIATACLFMESWLRREMLAYGCLA